MKSAIRPLPAPESALIKSAYTIVLFIMGLTGFGQMPIFGRYYIADIPGLGWLDRYYVTHTIHYWGAILLLALIVYCAVVYAVLLRRRYRLTVMAQARIVLLAGIVITGIFRVVKNLPDIVFSPGFTMFIDIAHLGFMLLYILVAVAAGISGSGWLRQTRALG